MIAHEKIACGYIPSSYIVLLVKTVSYTGDAAKDLRRHGNMADRLRKAIKDYAANPQAHANNVKPLIGQTGKRMTVGSYRIIFEESDTEIKVTKIGPRGGVYSRLGS
jgi:mRNA interferase RelE/StbE